MKRLRVRSVCLVVALLCWYSVHHAYCSEQGLSGPSLPAGDEKNNLDDHKHKQDSTKLQEEVVEWMTHTSHVVGPEAEGEAHDIHQEHTGTPHGAEEEEEETNAHSVFDTVPEPELSSDPVIDLDLQPDTQVKDRDHEAPVYSTLSPVLTSTDVPPAPKLLVTDTNAAAPSHEPDNTPTSQSAGPTPTHEDKADPEDQLSDQSHGCSPDTVVQSIPGRVEQEEEKEQEEGQADIEQDRNLQASQHQERQEGQATPDRDIDSLVPSQGDPDFLVFSEWKTVQASTPGSIQPVKKMPKNFKNNYASVECGAKILSANNEAKSSSAILMENMDLYMLNPCSNKIWFVIELCESIQVKQLDIANFELFSSSPKDFLVFLSDRYPTNKWVKLGTFHGRDERTVQSFPLDEQLYAKYVKVELLSHFGSEHFCPLSLFRVFGTSMVEEYEQIDSQYLSERQEYLDEDYDYPAGYQPSEDKASKNLLGSATNAILDMVNNIAANVLGGKPELQEGVAEAEGNVTAGVTPTPAEIPQDSSAPKPVEPEEHPTTHDDSHSTRGSSASSSLESQTDRQIVTLVEEEEDDEEPRQSTVTLMEEEGEEEVEKEEAAAGRNQGESHVYCPFLSLSLSCMATLPELLHRWCSAMLAKERLRRLHAQTRPRVTPRDSSPQVPEPVPTPSPQVLPLTKTAPEMVAPLLSHSEAASTLHVDGHTPQAPTPQLNFLLEPSRTAALHPHSLSDIHSSLVLPTPTHEYVVLPPVKDAALNTVPTPPLQAATVLEIKLNSFVPTFITSTPQQLLTQKTSPDAALPTAKEQPVPALPTASKPEDLIPPPTEPPAAPLLTDADAVKLEAESGDPHQAASQEEQAEPLPHSGDSQDSADEDLLSATGAAHRTATDFYAELHNGLAGNGAAAHGSSQKESVFMRLNNRIKALEMNMSLSSRYLEELSQRYRKQMEEMQKAFNKTIIKLQNTSRIAEEQDQKQQDSIQVLQSQLENVTRLMLNLTVTVSQLQKEVSDRQSYLVVSLILCLFLGLLLCLQCCRSSCAAPKADTPGLPKSNHYPSPKRCFSSYDDMSLKRRVTCPLVRSKSFHLSSTEVGPDDLYIVEPLRFSPEKKKKRCKAKSLDKVETLKASDPTAALTNSDIQSNGFHSCLPLPPPPLPLPPPPPPAETPLSLPCPSKELPSETNSCSSSSHSEESFAGRLPPPSPVLSLAGLCNGHELPLAAAVPPPKSRQERRSTKRRRLRQTELTFPPMQEERVASLPSLQQLMKGGREIGVGAIRVTAVGGHV